MPRVVLAVLAAVALLAGGAAAAAPVKVTLTVTSETPTVGAPWRWTVKTTAGGKPVRATVRIQALFGAAVVGCWKGVKMQPCDGATAGDPIPFRGTISRPVRWTAESRSFPLTFRALVTAGGKTRTLKVQITVK